MTCRDAETLLDRQLDGELAPDEFEALSAHLAHCATCALAAERVAAEQRMFDQLSAALHEQPPVWPAVRAAIRDEASRERGFTWNWRKTFWIGASALAASLLLVLTLARRDQSDHQLDSSPQTATLDAQARYLRAIDTVRSDAFAHLATQPTATAESLAKGLAELDATIAAARDAWRANPDDPQATRYLLSAYAHKLELLMRFVAAS